MARTVALARNLKLEWLDKTADLLTQTTDREQLKTMLNGYLGQSIKSPTVLRKTRELLLNTWHDADPTARDEAIRLYRERSSSQAIALHWAMLMLQFPVFCDLAAVIGKTFRYTDELSFSLIKQRMFETWGERNTLEHSLAKNIQMLRSFGVLNPAAKLGSYRRGTIAVTDSRVIALLLYSVLRTSGRPYMTWEEFINVSILFPFVFSEASQADIMGSDLLAFERLSGEAVICAAIG